MPRGSAAVLMARIVDPDGVAIRRADVAAIGYSVLRLTGRRDGPAVTAGPPRAGLRVADVLFDRLEVGRLWTLDGTGYNFRHEFDLRQVAGRAEAGDCFEINFIFTMNRGKKVAVRFVLRAVGL